MSNTAVAVNPDVDYVVARAGEQTVVVAEPLAAQGARRRHRGARHAARHRARALDLPAALRARRARGRELRRARRLRHHRRRHRPGAPVPRVRRRRHGGRARRTDCRWSSRSSATATSGPGSTWSAAQFFKDADEALVADLRARGLLFRHVPYTHSYPHCWRCHTPLMYYALPSWYVRTTAIKDRAARRERGDQLVPGHDQARPLRRLAEQQHRLGALARPVLGHAAAGVAQRRRPVPDGLRRLAGRTRASCPASRSPTRTARSSTTSPSPAPARTAPTAGCRR